METFLYISNAIQFVTIILLIWLLRKTIGYIVGFTNAIIQIKERQLGITVTEPGKSGAKHVSLARKQQEKMKHHDEAQ